MSSECALCFNTGLIEAVAHDASARTMMRCTCPCGTEELRKLPRFSGRWTEHFHIHPLIRNYAAPSDESTVNQKVNEWQARVQVAEEFWAYHDAQKTWGPVFEKQVKRWDFEVGQ